MEISDKTLKVLETAKQKENLICGYPSNQIENDFLKLTEGNKIEVGYRCGCGKIDDTHKIFKEWLKVLKSLKKDGFIISEKNITHPNKSPTMANGYWNSIIYSIN